MVESTARSNVHKAAVLLVSMEEDLAAIILSKLEKEQVELVTREIARLKSISQAERDTIIEEFYHVALARGAAESGGMGTARALLARASWWLLLLLVLLLALALYLYARRKMRENWKRRR